MKKHLYFSITAEDKLRINATIKRFVKLVGHMPEEREKLVLAVYENDFTEETMAGYTKAWCILDDMLGKVNQKKYALTTNVIEEMELGDLYNRIRDEQVMLSEIFNEFEQMGVHSS